MAFTFVTLWFRFQSIYHGLLFRICDYTKEEWPDAGGKMEGLCPPFLATSDQYASILTVSIDRRRDHNQFGFR